MSPYLLLVLCCAAAISAQVLPNQTVPDDGTLKSEAAEGHRHHHDRSHSGEHHRHHHHRHDDYNYGSNYYQPQIHDRYVCDLDASVLLVLSRSRGGLHKAHRVRCSDVAAADEDSCTVCCQNAARRDLTLKNDNIYGVLTDTYGFDDDHHHSHSAGEKANGRYKRHDGKHHSGSGEHHNRHGLRDSFPNGEKFPWKYGAPNFFKNVKCLCCAPRRHYAPQTPTQIATVQIPVPQYSQPAYQPPAQSPPAYGQPVYAQPVAQAPPVYQQQPQYQAPQYQAPQYQQQPQYQPPQYDQQPQYSQVGAAPPSPPVAAAPSY